MLWLDKKSLKNVSVNEYVDAIQQNFRIRKILQYSKKTLVGLTSKGTIVKILNPDLSKYQLRNLMRANALFSKCGIRTPRNLSVKKSGNFYIIENQYINAKLFFDVKPLLEADEAFLNLSNRLSKIKSAHFGPLIAQRKFLPPAFINCNYLKYWDKQFNYFVNKILDKNFNRNAKKQYKILRKEIKIPRQFVLSHSDISPKHLFACKSKIGCIDLEESMYLDSSFMWAIWYVRTINKRGHRSNDGFLNKFLSSNLDSELFIFHVYRELLIQYYYEGLLGYFFQNYSKFFERFQLRRNLTLNKDMVY